MLKTPQIALAGVVLVAACSAAAAPTERLRGMIVKSAGNVLRVKPSAGTETTLTLPGNARVIAVVKGSMADIREGAFLGSGAVRQPDGSQKALEVHVFAEELRGTGEGHRPLARVPKGTMTNGAVAGGAVAGIDGSTILLKYRGGETKIVVPSGTPIVRYEIGGAGDLKPGAHFTARAAIRKPDGSFEANLINVGRDGVVPQ